MERMPGMTYINGEFIPADRASLPLMDAGFWLGINVFDVLSARHGPSSSSKRTSTASTARCTPSASPFPSPARSSVS